MFKFVSKLVANSRSSVGKASASLRHPLSLAHVALVNSVKKFVDSYEILIMIHIQLIDCMNTICKLLFVFEIVNV